MFERKRKSVDTPIYVPVHVRPRAPQRKSRYTVGQEVMTMTMQDDGLDEGRAMGKVSALQREKGFGFINHPESGQDYFFHKSEALGIWDTVQQYDTVTFRPGKGPKGPRATEVELP